LSESKLKKKEKKNRTSEVINKIIPIFKPLETSGEWDPCSVVSFVMFIHHEKADVIMMNKIKFIFIWCESLHKIYITIFHEIMAFKIGHGFVGMM